MSKTIFSLPGVRAKGSGIEISFYHKGKRYYVQVDATPTKANQQAAAKQRSAIQSSLSLGATIDEIYAELNNEGSRPKVKSLGDYAQHFLDIVAPERVVDSTLMGYQSIYNASWLEFDQMPIDKIAVIDLQRHLSKRDITKKTRKEAVSVLRMIYDCATPEVFSENPINRWQIPKSKDDTFQKADPYSNEERDLLLNNLRSTPIAFRYFSLGFATGMRTGELLGLHKVDYREPYLHVHQEMVRRKLRPYTKTTSRGEGRYVLCGEMARAVINESIADSNSALMFTSPEGFMFKDADWLMDIWKGAHTLTGVRRREKPYPWRSTYISSCLDAGMNINDVSRQVGNSPGVIEKHYQLWIKKQRNEDRLLAFIEDALT